MTIDTLVIGAGQAGLAAAFHLSASGRGFQIVEAAPEIGASWSRRYRSLTLFTPRAFSALPGKTLDGNREGYATRDEFVAYLQAYAARLPVRLSAKVVMLKHNADGSFVATLAQGERIDAKNVIIATGGFQISVVPPFASQLHLPQFSAETYQAPDSVPEGTILVVGDGASGRDIAAELAQANRAVMLASGKPRRLFPERLAGKSVWWWLNLLGVLRASPQSWIGRRMRAADAFPDRNRSIEALQKLGVRVVGRATGGEAGIVTFANGGSAAVDAIVWCIGYRDDVSWVDVAGAHAKGSFVHNAGVSPVPGLFFVGRPWQRNRASGLIMGVGEDAKLIVNSLR